MSELVDIATDAKALLGQIERVIEDHRPCERCYPPHDGGQRLRPHSATGWWQVWSGGICIALLSTEDVAPIRDASHATPGRGEEKGERRG